ncbi:hypothetical protein BV912_06885 [Neisseria dumasiana]|uniref:Uncharacterized protein n=1 Tax=Neisseria dumasiana TaxID=1931275 RepID=A0A1X3DHM5_9NEIS|nr:hypothetical protein BV912_06885 [Neisseria dumasiana]
MVLLLVKKGLMIPFEWEDGNTARLFRRVYISLRTAAGKPPVILTEYERFRPSESELCALR